jgi:Acyl-CoA reductase (LuxC)
MIDRVEALCRAAARLGDASDPLGRRARAVLPASTGLSPENVELALTEILETRPSAAEIRQLCASVEPAQRVHVVLAANVFVAAHRAIALGLAQSAAVSVRPSRREPEMARLLAEASDGLFAIVDAISPEPGDHVWAYGSDETLAEIASTLPPGVVFHGHGAGFGLALVADPTDAARALALDVVPFDQRGCLSPRVVVFLGSNEERRAFARTLADELRAIEQRIPLGTLDPDEAAAVTRWRDTARFAGELVPAGSGFVSIDDGLTLPPVGRNVSVFLPNDLDEVLENARPHVAALGIAGPPELERRLASLLPGARRSALGRMQRPAFDGPVDLRTRGRL